MGDLPATLDESALIVWRTVARGRYFLRTGDTDRARHYMAVLRTIRGDDIPPSLYRIIRGAIDEIHQSLNRPLITLPTLAMIELPPDEQQASQ